MNLMEMSNGIADVVEAAGRSVVRVEGRSRPVSGTLVSADGHVVAISHTLERDEDVAVGLPDGRAARARVLGRDPATDLALLHVEASGLEPAPWRALEGARVGQLVLGIYRPGRTARATLGVLAALGDSWRTRFGGRIDRYLEASLTPPPGFSGGLLLDAAGGALALSTSGLMRGVALGLPANTVKRVTDALLAHGRVRRGYLGVGSQPVALPEAQAASLGQATGVLVVSVESDSPAARAGVLLGDVIVALEGGPVTQPLDLLPALDEERVGQAVGLRILRAGELRELRVTVGERGAAA
jgi:S1-C subfamily serine protease